MASIIKDKISKVATGHSSSETEEDESSARKYLLKVTAGSSYETSTKKTVVVNGEDCVINDNCKVAVRIREYQGIPGDSLPESAYFEDPAHSKDTYSIAFSWAPKEDVSAEDLVWGTELVNPIGDRIPKKFITTAFEICKRFVDPSLVCDPYADQPWVNGPILCGSAMTWSIRGRHQQVPSPDKVLSEGADEDGLAVRQEYSIPDDEAKRRKYFSDEEHRAKFTFEKGRCYQFDFHNGYIDWKAYALKLPGFSLSVLKWINDRTHTVRFVLKNRRTGHQYLVVTCRLLFGDELTDAVDESEQDANNEQSLSSTSRVPVVPSSATGVEHNEAEQHPGSSKGHTSTASSPSPVSVPESSSSLKSEEYSSEKTTSSLQPSDEDDFRSKHNSIPRAQQGSYMPENCGKPGTVQPYERDVSNVSDQGGHVVSDENVRSVARNDRQEQKFAATQQQLESMGLEDSAESNISEAEMTTAPVYRDSIEESLTQTMSVDGRGKPTNVLR